jgi:hypothetical protein
MTSTIRTIRLHPTSHPGPYASAAISLANLERYTCAAVDWPTPILPDENIEYWAQRYELYQLHTTGLRFILFLQSPLYWLRRC